MPIKMPTCKMKFTLSVMFFFIQCTLQTIPHPSGFQDNTVATEKLYIQLFKRQRAEQLEAIKSITRLKNFDKQFQIITNIAGKLFEVVQQSRAVVESSNFIPGSSPFPNEERVRDALSNILENTALFSEIVLRFPEVCDQLLSSNNNFIVLLKWSIFFATQASYLLDNSTVKLLTVVSQELNLVERDPQYLNPYRRSNRIRKGPDDDEEFVAKPAKKPKKKLKKGPKMASFHSEL